ncbi:hypothetical protein ABQE69_01270 [Mycolicibacillus trivialis]
MRPTRDEMFGNEFPQESSDERDPDAGRDDADHERWLRDNVPPHHR